MSRKGQAATTRQEHTPQRCQEFGRVHQVQEREYHNRDQLGQEKHHAGELNPNEHHAQPQQREAPEGLGITNYIDDVPYHAPSDQTQLIVSAP